MPSGVISKYESTSESCEYSPKHRLLTGVQSRMEGVLCAPSESPATMSDKTKAQKKRLARKENQNQRVPAWVMMKTDMNVTRNPKRRNWRRNDLDE